MNNEQWVDLIFTIISIFSTLMAVLVIYIVIFHSPSTMKGYTRYIINYTVWDFLFSLNLGVLVKPQFTPPFNCSYINGWFRFLGPDWAPIISMIGIVNTGGNCLSTQCLCLFYRFVVLWNEPFWNSLVVSPRAWVVGYIITSCICFSTYFIFSPMITLGPEMLDLIEATARKYPNATKPVLSKNPIMFTDPNNVHALYTVLFVVIGFLIAESVSFVTVFFLLRILESKKASFSKATYKLHRQLLIALAVQLLTPFLFIMLPVTYGIYLIYPVIRVDSFTAGLIINYIELYGTSNSIVTLYFIKPYRTYLKEKFLQIVRVVSFGRLAKEEAVILVTAPESTINSGYA
ncbi:unnamed protein product [Bursaphelenchus xylophilus]|uniref:(pine wood nematode) hypothetical protein n=1 Tax=Bursaphelenchus xylophilus TaxID=6326 RepID=A0A1I7RZG1_BURXY|nr:unnamed protein product [Bursaphelenchus xylophilus]CAG9106445.1 unnamed protein product [Bursaphelenchus xylophilus]